MKKIITLFLIIMLLASCQSGIDSPHKITTNDEYESYPYTVAGVDKELTLVIPFLNSEDEELNEVIGPVYSLNPLIENKNNQKVLQSTFYKNDEVNTYTKDKLYNLAKYGYGFWVLNDEGKNKEANNQPLTQNDYTLLYGDFYHESDIDNASLLKYYLATQELIWESITNPETGREYQIEFTTIDLTKEKSQILDAQREYSQTPFFGGSVINVTEERLEDDSPFTYVDSHQLLDRFTITHSNGIEILETEDPYTLSFVLNEISRNSKISFIPPFKIKQEISQVFSSDDNISYLSIGQDRSTALVSSLYIEQESTTNTIDLAIRTYDVDTKTEIFGAQYRVSTGPDFLNQIETTLSSDDLPAYIENLVPGTYYIQQIVAPEGYALNQEVESLSIKTGIIELTYPFYNTKK